MNDRLKDNKNYIGTFAKVIANLLKTLVDKGVLTKEEVKDIFKGI
ncbi:hypothetical protein P4U65_24675 [Bacillus pacificus]|nr:hypothetical protein [Bacillus thuringiensis]MED1303686.1 hypothetical protein [Bacillus pacificus]